MGLHDRHLPTRVSSFRHRLRMRASSTHPGLRMRASSIHRRLQLESLRPHAVKVKAKGASRELKVRFWRKQSSAILCQTLMHVYRVHVVHLVTSWLPVNLIKMGKFFMGWLFWAPRSSLSQAQGCFPFPLVGMWGRPRSAWKHEPNNMCRHRFWGSPRRTKTTTRTDEDEDGTEPKTKTKTKSSTSSIGQHLLDNVECLESYRLSMFQIVRRARCESILHILEPLYIKLMEPDLCKQLQFVRTLPCLLANKTSRSYSRENCRTIHACT